MPERTVQEVNTYNYSHRGLKGRHYVTISYETWRTFDLKKLSTKVRCEVNALLDSDGKPVFRGSEVGDCKPYRWFEGKKRVWHYNLVLSPKLVKKIGIREGLYIDMLLTHVVRFGKIITDIFPKRLVFGIMKIEPQGINDQSTFDITVNLIEHEFKDPFFSQLVVEINRAYGFKLYASTFVLLRKLIENLLIELLRVQYGTQKVEMYYWKEKGRHHDFSRLLENLKNNVVTFKPYSTNFNQTLVDFLDKFRDRSNAVAHSIDIQPEWDYIDSLKKDLNHYCEFFASVIYRIKGNSL